MLRSSWSPWPTLSATPPPHSTPQHPPSFSATQHNLQPCQHAALLTGSCSEAQRKQTGSDCENSAVGPSWCPPLISHKARFVRRADSSLALDRPTRWRLPGPITPYWPPCLSVPALTRTAQPPSGTLCIFWKGSIRKLIRRPVGKKQFRLSGGRCGFPDVILKKNERKKNLNNMYFHVSKKK